MAVKIKKIRKAVIPAAPYSSCLSNGLRPIMTGASSTGQAYLWQTINDANFERSFI